MLKNFLKILSLVICMGSAGQALAVTQTVAAHIAFATPLSVSQTSDISFTDIKVGATGSGHITVVGSKNQVVDISVDEHTISGGSSFSPTCSYNGGDAGSCNIANAAAPGRGKDLQLNLKALAAGAVADSTINSAFTVAVVYQ